MSQNYGTSLKGRRVLYGFDAPTGGFFFSEFYKEDEIIDDEELASSEDGLVLSVFIAIMRNKFSVNIVIRQMIGQIQGSKYPTPLQISVGDMFGKDIPTLLKNVFDDLTENYIEHLVEMSQSNEDDDLPF